MKTSLQMLLREPVKMVVLLLLALAASFGFFSQTAEYLVTTRLMAEAERNYRAIVSFRKPPQALTESERQEVHPGYYNAYPGLLEKLAALPSVASIDSQFSFGGTTSDCRATGKDNQESWENVGACVMAEVTIETAAQDMPGVKGNDPLTVAARIDCIIADSMRVSPEKPLPVVEGAVYNIHYTQSPSATPDQLFEDDVKALEAGKRYLAYISVTGVLAESENPSAEPEHGFYPQRPMIALSDVPEDYLSTPAFAAQSRDAEVLRAARGGLSFHAVTDMRNLMKSANSELFLVEGEGITPKTAGDVCVVSRSFAETNGRKLGDVVEVSVRYQPETGNIPYFVDELITADYFGQAYFDTPMTTVPLRIIGIYDEDGRPSATDPWAFDVNTVFVPHSVRATHFPKAPAGLSQSGRSRDTSIVLRSVRDVGAFYQQSANLFAEYQLVPVIGDYGWSRLAESFEQSEALAILKIIAFGAAAVFSFVLLAYLLVLRKSGEYAVMRALGVGKRRAGGAIALAALAVGGAGCVLGSAAGWVYTARTLVRMAANLPAAPDVPLLDGVAVAGALLLTLLAAVWAFTARLSRKSPMALLSTKR